MLNYKDVQKKLIIGACNLVNASNSGFAITNESICNLNAMNILNRMQDVDINKFTDEQIENNDSTYNTISLNYIFTE
ncbi:MAG: hypothetical protein MR346_09615 [Clostridium sp.]|nr:hypothetical protein [Clostridium sp.]